MTQSIRDYQLAITVGKLPDDVPIGSSELAAFLGVSKVSIQTGQVANLPPRLKLSRKMHPLKLDASSATMRP